MDMGRYIIPMATLKKGDGSMGKRIIHLLPIDCR